MVVVNEIKWLQLLLALRMAPWNENSLLGEADIDDGHLDQYIARMQETAEDSIVMITRCPRGTYYSASGRSARGMLSALKADNPLHKIAVGGTFTECFAMKLALALLFSSNIAGEF